MPTYRKKMSIRRRKPKSKSGVVSDSVKKYVKKATRKSLPEMKYSAVGNLLVEPVLNLGGTVAGYVWTEFANITQGVTNSTRIGNTINLQGFHSKITYFNLCTVPIFVRRLVVGYSLADLEGGTDAAEFFSINGQGTSFTAMTNNMAVIQTPVNTVQYKVYFDKTFRLAPSTSTDGMNTRLVNYFQKFGGKKITYEGPSQGILAQDYRFAEVIIACAAGNDPATGGLEFNKFSRTYFTDP